MGIPTHSCPRDAQNMKSEVYTAICFKGTVLKKTVNFPLVSTGKNKRDRYLIIAVFFNMTEFTLTEVKRSFGELFESYHLT
jgi:hypothetical protein